MALVVELTVVSVHDADGREKDLGVRFLGRNVATNVAQECALASSAECCVHELVVRAHKLSVNIYTRTEATLRVVVTGRHGNTMLLRLWCSDSSSELGKRTRPHYAGET